MGMIVATFLLLMDEEDAFWMMVAVVEDLLPASYYSPSLIGVQADQVGPCFSRCSRVGLLPCAIYQLI